MPDRAMTRLRRVTDLFVTGRELLLQDNPPDEPVLIWVNKLNAFQRAECQKDGSAGQARRLAGLSDDSDDIRAIGYRVDGLTRDELINYIVGQTDNTHYLAAVDDVRAEPGWTDKLVLIDRAELLAEEGTVSSEQERDAVAAVQLEYLEAVRVAHTRRLGEARTEWVDTDVEALRKEFIESFKRRLGMGAYLEEYDKTELFFAARDCGGTRAGPDGFDHTGCTHHRLLPTRAAVADIPEDLVERIRQVLSDINMTPQEAGNSAAPRTSSGPSEPPSSAEDSPASTPTET